MYKTMLKAVFCFTMLMSTANATNVVVKKWRGNELTGDCLKELNAGGGNLKPVANNPSWSPYCSAGTSCYWCTFDGTNTTLMGTKTPCGKGTEKCGPAVRPLS